MIWIQHKSLSKGVFCFTWATWPELGKTDEEQAVDPVPFLQVVLEEGEIWQRTGEIIDRNFLVDLPARKANQLLYGLAPSCSIDCSLRISQ